MAAARSVSPLLVPALDGRLRPAIDALAQGRPVLLFDAPDREGETDMVLQAEKVTPANIRALRKEAGGLIVVTIPEEVRSSLGLPYMDALLRSAGREHPLLPRLVPERFRYDRRSSFGISVNHRAGFTGIPDLDRALTVRALGELVRDGAREPPPALQDRFASWFLAPGHVPVLYAAPGGLTERRGHTELSTALARMGRLTPSLVLCEMLSDDGRSLPEPEARAYAEARGHPFVEGHRIVEAWSRWSG
jgi:3,4-dihydroxy 2-butanone 4-phosphate synthase